jgi:FkbM family methyltransferase
MSAPLGVFRRVVRGWRDAVSEVRFLSRLATTWPERASIARFVVTLYAARAMPFDTYSRTTTVRLRGATWHVGVRTSEVYVLEEVYGYRMYDRIDAYVPAAGWVVFDIGANVGVFSVLEASRGAQVYAFEPNAVCFDRLKRNVASNHLGSQVRPFNLALGDEPGFGSMHVLRGGTTGGTVVTEPAVVESSAPSVRVTTLDMITRDLDISRIDLLKLDVEGAEASVLRGGRHALDSTERVILEYHSLALLRDVLELLDEHGFVEDLRFVYYEKDAAAGTDEVGMLYARRRS